LGTDRKTPLSEVGTAAPGRSQKTQQRSKVARTRLIVGGIVVLAIVGGAIALATRGGDVGVIGDLLGAQSGPVPEVTLTVDLTTYEPTAVDVDQKTQQATADEVSAAVTAALEEMLRTAYVDPDTWDDPGDVADSFTGDAAENVETDVAVLTLGEDAGDVFESVEPGESPVSIKVLTGGEGRPLQAYARVAFVGLAEHDDGTYSELRVVGSYFLVDDDGAWKITSYRVDRNEKPAEAPAEPSASGTASASEGGSG
jgi:hypothetical protein